MEAKTLTFTLYDVARQTRAASRQLAALSTKDRDHALAKIADILLEDESLIVQANQSDCEQAASDAISSTLQSRLKLDKIKLSATVAGVRSVQQLQDPLNSVQIHRELDDGLVLKRITCPLGVVGVIFEARPEALVQITSLAIKSGNGVILKAGKEATQSCVQLVKSIHRALAQTAVPPAAVQLLTTREEIAGLLQLDKFVNLIIPRGSNALVKYVKDNTRIPVLGHADGICHIFMDESADVEKALKIIVDSKCQYPSACNALETLLIHSRISGQTVARV